jgi:hypothetical protein
MTRRDVFMAAGALLLLAIAIVRLAVPERSRIRPLSIEAFEVEGQAIEPSQTVTKEAPWAPPTDVYVMGWNPWIGAPSNAAYDADLQVYLPDERATIFIFGQRVTPPGTVDAWRSFSLPSGTGYKVLKGQKLSFRYRITNLGEKPFDTHGAASLLYFVPVEGN